MPFEISEIERLRYRVTDVEKSVTKRAVKELIVRERAQEALNSQRLKKHFDAP